MKQEMTQILQENILKFWMDNMIDHQHGGFYGRISGDGMLHPTACKGAILNARILWTFSAAYRVLRKRDYLQVAERAKQYLIDHFIDREYGGVFWSLNYDGTPADTKKQFYAIAFAVYGLSEFARATSDPEALQYAVSLFQIIETHALDHQWGGYIEATTRSWQSIDDMRLSQHDANYPKSQNTHLHILEAYTNLYRTLTELYPPLACGTPSHPQAACVAEALRNIICIFKDKILNRHTYHLDLFFNNDWTLGGSQIESYGHDIECSWLIHEAALVLGDKPLLQEIEPLVEKIARASEKGLNPDGSMIHEAQVSPSNASADRDLHWWVQAEAIVGFFNIYQHFDDKAALKKALRCWQYVKDNLIDYKNGEWYWSRYADGTLNTTDDKAGFWKCPYHNGRMCLEIIQRQA